MRIQLDCLPCFLRQILEASRMVTDRTDIHEKIVEDAIKIIKDFKKYKTPPELAKDIHNLVKIHTSNPDPYKKLKEETIEIAKNFYPRLKALLEKEENRLLLALKISAIGNTLDAGVYSTKDFEKLSKRIDEELKKDFAVADIEEFTKILEKAKTILIIGDNAGETVFDKILVEELNSAAEVFYAVRGEPIINDATLEDAYKSGLNECSKVISTGCALPGISFKECNQEFLEVFEKADLIISKGQGNYESLSEIKKENLFFLLKVKCPVIASHIGIEVNNYVFKKR